MNQTFRRSVARCGLMLMAALLFAFHGLAQQTLGSLNGTVVDPSGAAVPGATVTATNAAINVTATATTSGTGYFQIFNLPIGNYVVKVSREGFEVTKLTAIPVQEARATTVNATLKVGQTTESVTVTATPLLNATDTTNGYTLDASQIEITPLATGSFTQMAILSPGVNAELLSNLDSNSGLGNQPIWANGQRDTDNTFQVNGVDATNLFNGKSSSGAASQRYNFNIGSSATAGGEHSVGTSVYGSNGNSLPSPPPEFTQELRVNASMYDAQQGATSGAQIDVNTVTGTNNWHGQAYGSYANNSINASPFFYGQEYQLALQGVGTFPASMANPWLQRWTAGATVGGPIIKNKVFVFAAYQHRANADQGTGLSQMSVPSALTDDRSTTGLSAAAAVWGATVSPASIDPIASALFNAKLPNGQFLIPSSQSSAPYQYGVPNVNLIGTSVLTSDQATISVDVDVTKTDRLSAKYFYQTAPVSKPYGFSQTGGFPVTQNNGSQVAAIDNTVSLGSRFNWEQRLGFVRMGSYTTFNQTLAGGNLGINGTPTAPASDFKPGLPGLELKDFADNDQYSPSLDVGPYSSFVDMGYFQNRLNPSTNVIFTAGKHTIVAGGGYSYTQLNIDNNRDGFAEVTTSSFSNLLKGKVHASNVIESISNGRNNADRYYLSNEFSGYAQDKWQVQPALSLTLGVRYDYHGGLTEKYGNMFNFEPSLYNVTGTSTTGFTVNNAGFIVAGNNKYYPSSNVSDSTLTGRQWGISPRLGFAWSPSQDHGKVVISGGAGMYYDRGELFSYLSEPAGGSIGGPFGATEAAPLVSYTNGTGTHLADPLGTALTSSSYIPPSANPGIVTQALQNQLNQMTGQSQYYGPNCGGVDNQEGYLDCTPTLYFGAYDRKNVLPYTINYTLNFQWQPVNDVAITIGYAGNRGRHSVIPIPANEPGFATPTNPIWGETSTYGFEVLNQNSMSDGYDYDPIPSEPWNTASGGNTDFRAPYVGYNPSATFYKTAGVSAYDALETHIEKRLSHYFQVGASYTWSHALDEQSDIGLFFTGDDPKHLRDSWSSADFDRTHVFSANFQVQVPNTAKEHSWASYVANDWHLTGTGILQSGEPYSLYEFYGAVGSVNFGDYPNLANPVLGIKDPTNPKSAFTGNPGKFRGGGGNYVPALDPNQIAISYLSPGQDGIPASGAGLPQDIYETAWNKGERNIFRQAGQKRLDLSIRKNFRITEKVGLQYEFNAFNVTNTTSMDVPQDQAQIRQNSSCSNSAIAAGNNCDPSYYYVNYGQIVTSVNPADQTSALQNLDQIPYTTGTGKGIQAPTTIPVGSGTCVSVNAISNTQGCPNNAANFGSVTGTIGGARAFTMGMHITF
jgi:Carboxypeptidase regulatory-like domain/TonB dependent receptor